MKVTAHLVTMVVYDFDNHENLQDVINELQSQKYLVPIVHTIRSAELKDWTDEHPFNKKSTTATEIEKFFANDPDVKITYTKEHGVL